MEDAAAYSASELLGNGRGIDIRALRPQDREELVAAVSRTSPQTLYRRFFAAKRDFTEKEVSFFVNVDFVDHVALVALLHGEKGAFICGGARYVVVGPGRAEVAFIVVDRYQGHGIGAALLRHLVIIARRSAIKEFVAEVLPENSAMLNTFRKSGLHLATRRGPGVAHVTLQLE